MVTYIIARCSWVAVPVNYGMLSYYSGGLFNRNLLVAVPVNYGMLSYVRAECES